MRAQDLYERCVSIWSEQVAAVGPDDWSGPTPCTDWDVTALVGHLVGEQRWMRPMLEGKTIAEVGDSLEGDLLGADPKQNAKEAEIDSLDAVGSLFDGSATVHVSYGDDSAENYLRQVSSDHLIHSWDLATALGRPIEMPADLVADVADWFADWEAAYRQFGAIGERGTSDGTPQGDLLAAFGRSTG